MSKYEQIMDHIKKEIQQNKLKPGDKLPSLNEMSQHYQCAKGTVLKAYETLEKHLIIFSKPQSGYYVAANLIPPSPEQNIVHLDTGNPLVSATTFNEVKQCLNIAAEYYSLKSLDVTVRGMDSLNQQLVHYLEEDGIYAKQEQIYLIQGITRMLTIFSSMPFPNHKVTILIEEPTYSFYIRYLKTMHFPVKTIQRKQQIIDLNELERCFKEDNIKFFYTIPRHHNPTGSYYSHSTRKKIMDLAIKYDVYIIEDDYFCHYDRIPKYLPLYYFSNQSHCIYLRSYTKTLPFIRIGIAVVPQDFIQYMNKMIDISYYYSYHMPSLVSQATLEAYIQGGIYKTQYQVISHEIHEKRKMVLKVCKEFDSNIIEYQKGHTGYYFILRLSPKINTDFFIQELKRQQIYVSSTKKNYYHLEHYDNSIRLSLSRIRLDQIAPTLETIYFLAKQLCHHNT